MEEYKSEEMSKFPGRRGEEIQGIHDTILFFPP